MPHRAPQHHRDHFTLWGPLNDTISPSERNPSSPALRLSQPPTPNVSFKTKKTSCIEEDGNGDMHTHNPAYIHDPISMTKMIVRSPLLAGSPILVVVACIASAFAVPIIDVSTTWGANADTNRSGTGKELGLALGERSDLDEPVKEGFVPMRIWVPVICIILLILGIAIVSWINQRKNMDLSLALSRDRVNADSSTRVITAELLAGVNNGNGSNANAAVPRRTRRPRRTPSQISTKSLPAYNKEPGEEEVVIYRGPQDMEDEAHEMSIRVIDEEAEGDEDDVPRPPYTHQQYPDSMAHDGDATALLQHADEGPSSPNLSRTGEYLRPPGVDMPRGSLDSLGTGSSDETSSLMRMNSAAQESSLNLPQDDAPSYYSVVNSSDIPSLSQTHELGSPSLPTSPSSPSSRPQSAGSSGPAPGPSTSGFRSMFSTNSNSGLSRHLRAQSISSVDSAANPPSPTIGNSPGARTHRPSVSGSGSSIFSTFRTNPLSLSRYTLNNNSSTSASNLTSPSSSSLAPTSSRLGTISSPLSHTLVRTEFTYPKSGPTAEQVKLIASRESIAKFGVPFGADAVAYAQTSRLNLGTEGGAALPPAFEEVVSGGEGSGSGSGSGENGDEETTSTEETVQSSDYIENSTPSIEAILSTVLPLAPTSTDESRASISLEAPPAADTPTPESTSPPPSPPPSTIRPERLSVESTSQVLPSPPSKPRQSTRYSTATITPATFTPAAFTTTPPRSSPPPLPSTTAASTTTAAADTTSTNRARPQSHYSSTSMDSFASFQSFDSIQTAESAQSVQSFETSRTAQTFETARDVLNTRSPTPTNAKNRGAYVQNADSGGGVDGDQNGRWSTGEAIGKGLGRGHELEASDVTIRANRNRVSVSSIGSIGGGSVRRQSAVRRR